MDITLEEYLREHKIKFKEYGHRAVFTVDESSDLKKSIPGLHCKCLFMKDSNGKFYLVGMPAEKRLDIKNLRKMFDVGKMHFASAEELFEKLKLKPGSVSIFGLVNNFEKDVFFILDKDVWNAEAVGFHPNLNTSTIVLKHDDLERFYNSVDNRKEVVDL